MEGKPLARATESALDLIHNQNGPPLFRKFPSRAIEPIGDGTNTAFTVNCFDQTGTNVICQLSLEVGRVVKFDEIETGHQWFELLSILLLTGCRQGAERAPME